MDYKARLNALAEEVGARIEYRPGFNILESYSEPDFEGLYPSRSGLIGTGRVVIPEFDGINDRKAYWVGLHELGHLASRHLGPDYLLYQEGKPRWEVTDAEAEAWLWGIDKHGGEIDPDGEWAIGYSMSTYARDFGASGPFAQRLAEKVGAVIA